MIDESFIIRRKASEDLIVFDGDGLGIKESDVLDQLVCVILRISTFEVLLVYFLKLDEVLFVAVFHLVLGYMQVG